MFFCFILLVFVFALLCYCRTVQRADRSRLDLSAVSLFISCLPYPFDTKKEGNFHSEWEVEERRGKLRRESLYHPHFLLFLLGLLLQE